MHDFKDKVILVVGGAGSIGSEIVRQLIKEQPSKIRIYDNRETELFHLKNELRNHENVRYFLGDIREKEHLELAMAGVDIVFHTAALKHVPSCEYNPFEAVKTNVVGTQNIVETALKNNVDKVINISTDKVTNPINTMGATKLLAERIVHGAQYLKGDKRTKFASVRFGNVIGSNGSVLEVFKRQLEKGTPLTITHPDMTRFIMSIPQAVELVIKTARIMKGGEIFVLKMPAFKLKDFTEVIVEELAPKYGYNPIDVKVEYIGVRPGEKMNEDLMTSEETQHVIETEELFILLIELNEENRNSLFPEYVAQRSSILGKKYCSSTTSLLNKEELRDFLKKNHFLV